MFGLTKRQFIKRSKECLDAEGIHSLTINELIEGELSGKIDTQESYQRIRAVMKDLDSIFQRYEKLNPPSSCISTKLKILNSFVLLQESASALYDHITEELNNKNLEDKDKLNESKLLLNKFRTIFRPLTNEIGNII